MANDGPVIPLGLIEKSPHGLDVEIPKVPSAEDAFTCKTVHPESVGAQPGSRVSPGANAAKIVVGAIKNEAKTRRKKMIRRYFLCTKRL